MYQDFKNGLSSSHSQVSRHSSEHSSSIEATLKLSSDYITFGVDILQSFKQDNICYSSTLWHYLLFHLYFMNIHRIKRYCFTTFLNIISIIHMMKFYLLYSIVVQKRSSDTHRYIKLHTLNNLHYKYYVKRLNVL